MNYLHRAIKNIESKDDIEDMETNSVVRLLVEVDELLIGLEYLEKELRKKSDLLIHRLERITEEELKNQDGK